jgi:hypothetical protein
MCSRWSLVVWMVVLTALIGTASQAEMVAEWKFDGNLNDTSGFGTASNGVFAGAPGGAAIVNDAERGQVLQTLGTGWVDVGNDPKLINEEKFSIEAWVKVNDETEQNWQYIAGKSSNWSWRMARVGEALIFVGTDVSGGTGWANMNVVSGGIFTDSTTWHHVIASYQQYVGLKLWADGNLVATTPLGPEIVGWIWRTNDPVTIGVEQAGSGNTFNGRIDDLRLYNSVVPEPATLTLLALGGLLLRRKKH